MFRTISRVVSVAAVTALMLGAGITLLGTTPASAAGPTFTVNDDGDYSIGSNPDVCESTNIVDEVGTCTLRAALQAADNLDTSVTIVVPDPTTVAIDTSSAYLLSSGYLDVSDDSNTVTICGTSAPSSTCAPAAAANEVTIEANVDPDEAEFRDLRVGTGTTADISNLAFINGVGNDGGGILNCGTLDLSNSYVTDNFANGDGGGIEQSLGGSTTLDNVTVNQNNSDGNGGGVDVTSEGEGTSTLTIEGNSLIADNQSGENGGGVAIDGTDNPSTMVTIEDSTISNNSIDAEADPDGNGLAQNAESTLKVTNTTINQNTPGGDAEVFGGGVALRGEGSQDTFTADAITNNEAYDGAGVEVDDGTVTFENSTISGNMASEAGGGAYIDTEDSEVTTIDTSTVSGNQALGNSGESPVLGDGGGVFSVTFDASDCNDIVMTDDTVNGNSAGLENGEGGGFASAGCGNDDLDTVSDSAGSSPHARSLADVESESDQTTQLTFDTFDSNFAGANEGAAANIDLLDDSSVTLTGSIVADPQGGSDEQAENRIHPHDSGGGGVNCNADLTSGGDNLIDDSTCGTPASSDIIGQEPQLGFLGDNGGPQAGNPDDSSAATVQTELPGTGSPAIGGVSSGDCTTIGVTSDERGVARPSGANGTCTIGAVEIIAPTPPPPPPPPPTFNPNGYRMAASDGGVFDFGIQFHGSLANAKLNAPIVGIANNPGPNGYLLVGADGGVFALGGATYFGSLANQHLGSPVAAIAATPDGGGYWLVTQQGAISNFGDALNLPSVQPLAGDHIVGIASTNDGQGLWLVDNAGIIYTQGDAAHLGSMAGDKLNAPIVGIAAAATGQGYVLVASDGGVFTFGVPYEGSVPGVLKPGQKLNAPAVGIAVTHSGSGYWVVAADGGVFCFGDAPFLGDSYTQLQPGQHLNAPIIGIQHLGSAPV